MIKWFGFVAVIAMVTLLFSHRSLLLPLDQSAKKVQKAAVLGEVEPEAEPTQVGNPTITDNGRIRAADLLFGVTLDDYANRLGQVEGFATKVGRSPEILSFYKQFGLDTNTSIRMEDLSYAKSQDMTLLVAWEPWSPHEGLSQTTDYLLTIPTGAHDGYIRDFARSLQSYESPVVLRFGHEMNGNWYPWGQRADAYKRAYRYIVQKFREENVANVRFLWSVNAENVPTSSLAHVSLFYPGDDVVDVVGVDGFNFGSTHNGSWRSFSSVFAPMLSYLHQAYINKPLWITETASAEQGGSKAEWIQDMFNELQTTLPYVEAIVWFNLMKEADWRIDSTDASEQAMRENLSS